MNQTYKTENISGKEKTVRVWSCMFFLLLFVSLSGIVLCMRMGIYVYMERADTAVELVSELHKGVRQEAGRTYSSGSFRKSGIPDASKKEFEVRDDQKIWDTETEIELFHAVYENGGAAVTVAGGNGEKVFAPGTENSYTFQLINSSDSSVRYHMEAFAQFSAGVPNGELPVCVRVRDYTGRYLLGNEGSWESFEKMNEISEESALSADRYTAYTIDWQWSFESGQDEFDTFLGDLAAGQDLRLNVKIRIVAEQDPDSGTDGGIPKTGDTSKIWVYAGMTAVSLFMMSVLLVFRHRKKKKEKKERTNERY